MTPALLAQLLNDFPTLSRHDKDTVQAQWQAADPRQRAEVVREWYRNDVDGFESSYFFRNLPPTLREQLHNELIRSFKP